MEIPEIEDASTNIEAFPAILLKLKCMRKRGSHCDAVLATEDGGLFYVHRTVMTLCSSYFRTIFTTALGEKIGDSKGPESRTFIIVPNISSGALEIIIRYAYSGKTTVTADNVNELLPAADQFNVLSMIDCCKKFLVGNLSPENCLGVWRFGKEYLMPDLEEAAKRYAILNFRRVMTYSEEMLELPPEALQTLLQDDQLNIQGEYYAWIAIKRWCRFSYPDRLQHIPNMLKCVRLPLLPVNQFQQIMDDPRVYQDEQCRSYIQLAAKYFLNELKEAGNLNASDLSLFTPRYPQGLLFSIGGWSITGPIDIIEVYDNQMDSWNMVDPINPVGARVFHKCVSEGSKIYLLGGSNGNTCFSSCFCFDTTTKTYETLPDMFEQRCYLSAVLLSDRIYAIGGYDGNNRLQTVECFDIKQKQWTYVSSMHQVRSDATASVLRNRIFVMGGFNGVEFLSSVECYYVEFDQWFLLPSMLSCRSGLGSAAHDNCIFAIGGFDGIKRLTTVEKYDLNSQLWFPAKPMQRPRSNFAVEILEDKIYVVGGYNDVDEVITDVCECYDLLKPKWRFVAPIGVARSGLSVCKVSQIQNLKDFIRIDKARCLVRDADDDAGRDEVEERLRALRM